MEITVYDNKIIDDQDPRTRYIKIKELRSMDPLYTDLVKEALQITVLVYDDEYCDPDICIREEDLPPVDNTLQFDDHLQDVQVRSSGAPKFSFLCF